MLSYLIYALVLGLPIVFFFQRSTQSSSPRRTAVTTDDKNSPKTIMQPPRDDLDPPKHDPITLSELAQYDGSDESKPIYVSIKGDVFDVTGKRDSYGKGKPYNVFAGKDGSRGLGKSSLQLEDAVPDYSTLPENEMKVLNDWHAFFSKRYNIVGRVSDMPASVSQSQNADATAAL